MNKKRVLMTGATGYIADQMLPTFRDRYEMLLTDISTKNRRGEDVEGITVTEVKGFGRGGGKAPGFGGATTDPWGFDNINFADGHVAFFGETIDQAILDALTTRAGEEIIDFSRF